MAEYVCIWKKDSAHKTTEEIMCDSLVAPF